MITFDSIHLRIDIDILLMNIYLKIIKYFPSGQPGILVLVINLPEARLGCIIVPRPTPKPPPTPNPRPWPRAPSKPENVIHQQLSNI